MKMKRKAGGGRKPLEKIDKRNIYVCLAISQVEMIDLYNRASKFIKNPPNNINDVIRKILNIKRKKNNEQIPKDKARG